MNILDDIRTILNIEETSKDYYLLQIYVRQSKTRIKKYLNTPEELDIIETKYADAIICDVTEMYQNRGISGNVASKSEGAVSVSFANHGLSDNVKALLPKPYVRLV